MGGRRPTMETEQLGHGRRLPEFLPPSPVWDGNTLPRGAPLEAPRRLANSRVERFQDAAKPLPVTKKKDEKKKKDLGHRASRLG